MGAIDDTRTSAKKEGGKDLDRDGIVRLEVVRDGGQEPVTVSFRLRATVILKEEHFKSLDAAFRGGPHVPTPREVVKNSGTTTNERFIRMTPDEPTVVHGTGGVPNYLLTMDMRVLPPRTLFTIHTEVFLKQASSDLFAELSKLTEAKKAGPLAKFLATNGESVDAEMLDALLDAALD